MNVRSNVSAHRRLVLGVACLAVAALGLTSVATSAWFTDTATSGDNTFATGSIALSLTSGTDAAVTFDPGMMPGDVVTGELEVNNDGLSDLRYSLTSLTTDALGGDDIATQLDLTIKEDHADCTDGGFAAGGTLVRAAGDLGSELGINLIGDPAVGQQGTDRVLLEGVSETLCFQVVLPTTTDSTFQDKTTTAVFTFNAEQTNAV